ncbi:CUAEP/CCAEP-tail radical SAM (seleno)protein [Nonomuraea endophytica]|uniref:CUAEP/CCAEP-tail radical SAM (seleno)protein n=1 Tax=Nonomuraea endophytica TaxID=714136 RepID=UPI0037C9867D
MLARPPGPHVVLISTYELGHQPFGLASPAAWLRAAGAEVSCLDLAVDQPDEDVLARADLVAFYLPMHTATRIAAGWIPRVRALNPRARLAAYGLYAPMNEELLKQMGVSTVLGGEFEQSLTALVTEPGRRDLPLISLERLAFHVPDRTGLPDLARYAYLTMPDGTRRVVGYTEATRGCKHMCRHCPIVPVYGGRFRVVEREVVLADVDQLVAAGAQHLTFGDPDFFNGPAHARAVVTELHQRHPELTYDVTIKVEHLRQREADLPLLKQTGCVLVTCAVEAFDEVILDRFDKRHSAADFAHVVGAFRELGLALNPTFVAFSPWTTPQGYLDFLSAIAELGLVGSVAPVQYSIRLLIPAGSELLKLGEVTDLVGEFDPQALCHPWRHPDPAVDELHQQVLEIVRKGLAASLEREELFTQLWSAAAVCAGQPSAQPPPRARWGVREQVPTLSEPWYCCAEPTEEQLAPKV